MTDELAEQLVKLADTIVSDNEREKVRQPTPTDYVDETNYKGGLIMSSGLSPAQKGALSRAVAVYVSNSLGRYNYSSAETWDAPSDFDMTTWVNYVHPLRNEVILLEFVIDTMSLRRQEGLNFKKWCFWFQTDELTGAEVKDALYNDVWANPGVKKDIRDAYMEMTKRIGVPDYIRGTVKGGHQYEVRTKDCNWSPDSMFNPRECMKCVDDKGISDRFHIGKKYEVVENNTDMIVMVNEHGEHEECLPERFAESE